MLYNIRWLHHSEIQSVINLSTEVYTNEKHTYGPNLGPNSNLFRLFLVSDEIDGADYRKIIGVFDDNDKLLMVIGVRRFHNNPSWVLSWMISNVKSAKFMSAFKQALTFACAYFEAEGCKEFHVIQPVERENAYRYIIKFMRERYWTFVEMTIPKFTKCKYSFYWESMGYQLFRYDIQIRRYILKRDQND